MLTLAYTISFIDRQVLNLLVDPIRSDLSISDTQISLLQGLAFAVFYSVLGVPIARLADRSNRRNIIVIGMVLWCIMTAACGLAKNFIQLFLARVGVGIGEAALSPPAYSIIADYFPPDRLAKATGTYSLGVYAGAGIATLVGGFVIDMVSTADAVTLPLLGSLKPWQLTFLIVGLPGLLVAALMFTVKEPRRSDNPGVAAAPQEVPFREVVKFLAEQKRIIVSIFIGFSFLGIVMIGFLSWTPTFFSRVHGWSTGEIGFNYGWVLLIFGTTGSFAGGVISDWRQRRGTQNAPIRTAMLVSILALPFAVAIPLVNSDLLALALLAPLTFFISSPVGLSAAAIQTITPNRMRAQVTALYFLVVALIGTGFGPLVVALCTDYVFGYDNAVGYALALVSALLLPLGVACLYLGLQPRNRRIAAADIHPS